MHTDEGSTELTPQAKAYLAQAEHQVHSLFIRYARGFSTPPYPTVNLAARGWVTVQGQKCAVFQPR
jgi:hypothetical protein